jgi:microcystin-dependent protein
MPDSHANFSYSTVLTPPSPAASGLSLAVRTGDGAIFPLPPFNAIVCPVNAAPLVGNAEVLRVSGIVTDTFTIARTQEGSNARAIQAGDQIYAAITAKVLTDIEALIPIGAIQLFGGATAPAGFLLCDGTTYARSAYPALAAVLGSTYGGDANNFVVPDMKGRAPIGAGAGAGLTGRSLGQKPGVEKHTHAVSGTIPSLSVSGSVGNHHHPLSANGSAAIQAGQDGFGNYLSFGPLAGGFNVRNNVYTGSSGTNANAGTHTGTALSGTTDDASAGISGTAAGTSLSGGAAAADGDVTPSTVLNYIIRAK